MGRRVTGPHVAELYDADPEAAQPWLAVRYVPGLTLDREIAVRGPLTGPALDRFAVATAEALAQIHAVGITHRDLKPSNVIVTESTPVLIDFGIATTAHATALTATGITIGTSGWMAPEQVLGHLTTSATDVFSWGALLAYASSGVAPYGTGRPESLAYRIVHAAPDLSAVPDSYKSIVTAAMANDPAHRPTVLQLIEALGGRPIETSVQQVMAPTAPIGNPSFNARTHIMDLEGGDPAAPVSRWRMPAIIAAAVTVVGIGVGAFLLLNRDGGAIGGGDEILATQSEVTTPTSTEVTSTTTTTEATTTTTTATTTEPPPTTTEPPPPPPPPPPEPVRYEAVITPLTNDIHEFLEFTGGHRQEVVTLDLRFYGDVDEGFFSINPEYEPSIAHLFVCAGAADEPYIVPCWDGVEMMIHDLDSVADASLYYEHGFHRLTGRFAVQGISGPHQGIFGIGLRAVPIA